MTLEHEYDVFVSATNSFVDLVSQIEATSWASPGLGEWDLRALVGHTSRSLITVTQYVDQPVDTQDLDSAEAYYLAAAAFAGADQVAIVERGRQAGEALGADPAATVADVARSATARLRDQPDLLMHTIVGGMLLSDYLPTRTFELAVHCLDIAEAVGAERRLEPDVLSAAVALAGRVAVRRGDGVDLLLALTGRHALGPEFSVV